MKRLSIVIPTFNRKDYLKKLINQICDQILKSKMVVKIIVVVDGSVDGTIEMLDQYFPEVLIINGDGSWWYTKSMNEGFKLAMQLKSDYVLTLNDDIILANDYFTNLLRILSFKTGNTIYGSIGLTIEKPHRIFNGGNYYRNNVLSLYGQYFPFLSVVDIGGMCGTKDSLTLPGRGMLIPLGVLKELNLFDEKFKQYHSDGDFTLRARKMGAEVKVSYDLKVFVKLLETSDSTSYLNKSYLKLIKSYFNPTSRIYIPNIWIMTWRHGNRYLFLLRFLIKIVLPVINVYRKKII